MAISSISNPFFQCFNIQFMKIKKEIFRKRDINIVCHSHGTILNFSIFLPYNTAPRAGKKINKYRVVFICKFFSNLSSGIKVSF